MFEALVITLREGTEAALVLSIALAFLRRRGLERLNGALLGGAGCALVLSAGAVALTSRWTYNEELAEGIAMLVGAAMVLTLVWWMWKAAPRMKQEIEAGVGRAVDSKGSALGVSLFAFAMVFREGAETALFLSAAGFNSQGLGLWLGAIAGLVLAAIFGVLFARGSVRLPLRPFFAVTTAVLTLLAVQLLVGGLHELSEAGALPSSRAEMALVGPVIKNELLLFTLTVALAAGWLLFGSRREPAATRAPDGSGPRVPVEASPQTRLAGSGPQARLARAAHASETSLRRWTGAIALAVVGLLATAFVTQSRTPEKEPARALSVQQGSVRLETAPLADGHTHFFEVPLPEGTVRFFAVQVGDEIRTCFDACEICGDMGYYEEGIALVCRNCTSPIVRSSLGRTGGCNPIPLAHQMLPAPGAASPAELEIRVEDLKTVLSHREGR